MPPRKADVEKQKTITMKTGGAYIPPHKLKMMAEGINDKSRYTASTHVHIHDK